MIHSQTRIYYLKNNYLTFRSKVKVQQRSLWYTTHHLMDMHPHTKYHWPISKDIFLLYVFRDRSMIFGMGVHKRCVAYQNDLCLDLDLWPQGQVIVSFEIGQWYLVCTLRSKDKVPWRSLRYVTHHLMVMHPHTKYHWPISKDKNIMARTVVYHINPIATLFKGKKSTFRTNYTETCGKSINLSSPGPKVHLMYSHHFLSVVHKPYLYF
jgi:hypothetical protein